MKRKLFLPVLAVVFAVGGAFASNRFIEGYYENSDVTCSNPIPQPCVPGEGQPCLDENSDQYRFKSDVTEGSETCVLLEKNPTK